ncbi:hypothetical protein H696_01227 [Fonticula alba]|uniref:Uncharacterized protein n=1 Tax=Fonticula alba TaxID=691883 RepID=A0A058ZBN1_FONAL|nr:hypothetical protein H696_01227 [Fonticula alba]KCV71809.1 hypothetical protein H696_01227 [Fonticula alba]|eukprot:XP_009493387.1 hypothetical protein H696_01227 [Fonticula alba]
MGSPNKEAIEGPLKQVATGRSADQAASDESVHEATKQAAPEDSPGASSKRPTGKPLEGSTEEPTRPTAAKEPAKQPAKRSGLKMPAPKRRRADADPPDGAAPDGTPLIPADLPVMPFDLAAGVDPQFRFLLFGPPPSPGDTASPAPHGGAWRSPLLTEAEADFLFRLRSRTPSDSAHAVGSGFVAAEQFPGTAAIGLGHTRPVVASSQVGTFGVPEASQPAVDPVPAADAAPIGAPASAGSTIPAPGQESESTVDSVRHLVQPGPVPPGLLVDGVPAGGIIDSADFDWWRLQAAIIDDRSTGASDSHLGHSLQRLGVQLGMGPGRGTTGEGDRSPTLSSVTSSPALPPSDAARDSASATGAGLAASPDIDTGTGTGTDTGPAPLHNANPQSAPGAEPMIDVDAQISAVTRSQVKRLLLRDLKARRMLARDAALWHLYGRTAAWLDAATKPGPSAFGADTAAVAAPPPDPAQEPAPQATEEPAAPHREPVLLCAPRPDPTRRHGRAGPAARAVVPPPAPGVDTTLTP